MKYQYKADNYGPYDIDSSFPWDEVYADSIIEECAEDYHSNHDGWEDLWPIKFELYSDTGELLSQMNVDRETQPLFVAREIK